MHTRPPYRWLADEALAVQADLSARRPVPAGRMDVSFDALAAAQAADRVTPPGCRLHDRILSTLGWDPASLVYRRISRDGADYG